MSLWKISLLLNLLLTSSFGVLQPPTTFLRLIMRFDLATKFRVWGNGIVWMWLGLGNNIIQGILLVAVTTAPDTFNTEAWWFAPAYGTYDGLIGFHSIHLTANWVFIFLHIFLCYCCSCVFIKYYNSWYTANSGLGRSFWFHFPFNTLTWLSLNLHIN